MGAPGWWEAKHLALAAFTAQQFYMTWHLWGSIAIRSEMAEIQDCACCRRPTAGLYQLQLGRCTAWGLPQRPPGGLTSTAISSAKKLVERLEKAVFPTYEG